MAGHAFGNRTGLFFRLGWADPSRRQYGHERGGRPEPEMGFPMTRIKIFPDGL